jgi:hypothetical protein
LFASKFMLAIPASRRNVLVYTDVFDGLPVCWNAHVSPTTTILSLADSARNFTQMNSRC